MNDTDPQGIPLIYFLLTIGVIGVIAINHVYG
jgi:hypothetical protein